MSSRLVDRRPFALFYGLAVAIVAGVVAVRIVLDAAEMLPNLFAFLEREGLYANIISIGRFAAAEDGRAWLIFVFAGAPTLAALVVVTWRGGRVGLVDLLSRLRPWRDGVTAGPGLRVYGVLLGCYFGIAAAYLVATRLWVGEEAVAATFDTLAWAFGSSSPALVLALLLGAVIDEGGTLEELGWRGFALPVLIERLGDPLRASLLLGVLWWAWHFPREIPNLLGGVDLMQWAYGQSVFVALCLALSVLITPFWFRTGGSVWPAILIHGGTNVWSKALGTPLYQLTPLDLRSLLVFAGALIVLLVFGRELGRVQESAASSARQA